MSSGSKGPEPRYLAGQQFQLRRPKQTQGGRQAAPGEVLQVLSCKVGRRRGRTVWLYQLVRVGVGVVDLDHYKDLLLTLPEGELKQDARTHGD